MPDHPYRTQRAVLRSCPSLTEVAAVAREHGWPALDDEVTEHKQEVTWDVGPAVLHYVADRVSVYCYIQVSGPIGNIVDGFFNVVTEELRTWSLDELLSDVDEKTDPLQLGRALIRLAIGSPKNHDERVFDRTKLGLEHSDVRTQEMAIWATTYAPYPRFRPLLREIQETTTDQGTREWIEQILDAFDQAGVDEP